MNKTTSTLSNKSLSTSLNLQLRNTSDSIYCSEMADGHTCETATAPIDQNDETAIQGVAATPVAQRLGGRTPALGELPGGLTVKDYFAKQEKIRIFAA